MCYCTVDVLILRQFMREDGHVVDRDVTGLCRRQHQRVSKLIKMAAKAGLFPRQLDQYRADKEDAERRQWTNFNTYWDEKSIDEQYRISRNKQYIKSFKK